MALFRTHANDMFNHALQFAAIAHGSQVRKGLEHVPYVMHCVDVAQEVMYYSGLPIGELLIASVDALLHDTVEDTAVTVDNIREQFGDEAALDVAALTKHVSTAVKKNLSKHNDLIKNLARIKARPQRVWAVKMADRISNLKNFPAMWDREKIDQYLTEASIIARELGDASEALHARLLSRITQTRMMLSLRS